MKAKDLVDETPIEIFVENEEDLTINIKQTNPAKSPNGLSELHKDHSKVLERYKSSENDKSSVVINDIPGQFKRKSMK